jgi:hypothetical protein
MFNFIVGVITGIVISTVVFSGVANMADHGVHKVQEAIKETTKQ